FLDEIQATPWALQALRYFYEDYPELPVIAAGSLLEFVLSKHSFSMPVGRIEYLHLGPMSFEEYLQARDKRLLDYIVDFDFKTPIPATVHKQLLEKQREYLFVGGMPESVARFVQSNEYMEAVKAQQSIIETYKDDFSKYCKADQLIRFHRVFNYVPSAVGRKTKYCHISREDKARELKNTILLLTKAGVITPIYHSSCSGIPLHAQENDQRYKLLFLDIGLMNRVCALDWLAIRAMDERKLINEGSIAEQFIGQHLLLLRNPDESPRLNYWIREQKTSNAEVDYVISRGDVILPIEVKAGRSGSLKSLFQFTHEKNTKLAIRFDLNPPSFQTATHKTRIGNRSYEIKVPLLSLPLYLVEQLHRIIDRYREAGHF
ncbi:MAG: ATP-binding protein, partial [Bacteroidetes bacterium]|nr:ATP-binding protein [Bacteroidota bacterium]